MDIVEKVVNESIAAQNAAVDAIRKHRYEEFKLEHARPFVETVKKMETHPDQSKEALDLYTQSLSIHYDTLCSLTDTITPIDTAFLEWQQTPVALEVMYGLDPDFREAVEEFARAVDESEDIIGLEAMRVHCGFYGIISAKDFAAIPGSTFNVIAQVVARTDMAKKYKQAILSSKSWGLNTTYVFGDKFTAALGAGKTVAEAIAIEQDWMKRAWLAPVKTQTEIMRSFGHSSYDIDKYFATYRKHFTPYIEAAHDAGVHIANIVMLPTHVGDVGHHIGPAYYNICKDEMAMQILQSVTDVTVNTLQQSLADGKLDSVYKMMNVATGASASAIAEILALDGFTVDMLINFLSRRFDNYVQKYPFTRPMVGELHINDFLDFASRGEKINLPKTRGGTAKVGGVEISHEPIYTNDEINHPEKYAYPFCAVTTRATALMRFLDMPCLLAPEPPSITGMVNACALTPDKPAAPIELCKNCATARATPAQCAFCWAKNLKL